MKTNVRTKLSWSKFILASAIFAIIAMLSVLGLFFTNANADDAAEPANANLNIPVNNLAFEQSGNSTMYVSGTNWETNFPKPLEPKEPVQKFSYSISDATIQWTDEKKASYIKLSEKDPSWLEVGIAAKSNGQPVYKIWTFLVKGNYSWYLVENGKSSKVTPKSQNLNTSSTYSIYYGRPETFGIKSDTTDVANISGHYITFYGERQDIKNVPLPTTFDLTGQVDQPGTAYYIPDTSEGFSLILQFKDVMGRSSGYTIQFKTKDNRYAWSYNGNPVSTDYKNPTKIEVGTGNANIFTIQKAAAPDPIPNFKVKGKIVDAYGNPIPNAIVGFYNSDLDPDFDEALVTVMSGADGSFVLDGCCTGTKDPEKMKITYTAKHYGGGVVNISYDKAKTGLVDVGTDPELDPAKIDLYSDSSQHKSFTVTEIYQEKGKEPEINYCRTIEYYGISDLTSNAMDTTEFNVLDNGVLYASGTDEEGDTSTVTIVPNSQDGYIFDNYTINDKTAYRVGDSVDIMQPIMEDGHAKINVNYTVDSSKIAKTGDVSPYLAIGLAVIAVAAGAVVALRRRSNNF